jgi:hypothetical protein
MGDWTRRQWWSTCCVTGAALLVAGFGVFGVGILGSLLFPFFVALLVGTVGLATLSRPAVGPASRPPNERYRISPDPTSTPEGPRAVTWRRCVLAGFLSATGMWWAAWPRDPESTAGEVLAIIGVVLVILAVLGLEDARRHRRLVPELGAPRVRGSRRGPVHVGRSSGVAGLVEQRSWQRGSGERRQREAK